jgi:hypothetical protein
MNLNGPLQHSDYIEECEILIISYISRLLIRLFNKYRILSVQIIFPLWNFNSNKLILK